MGNFVYTAATLLNSDSNIAYFKEDIFNIGETRDANGRWTAGGGGGIKARAVQKIKEAAPKTIKEGAVAGAGIIGSLAGSHFGIIGALAAESTATVAARGVAEIGEVALSQRQQLRQTEVYQQATKLGKLKQIGARTISELKTPSFQKKLGDSLAGDLSGFAGGNLAGNTIGNAMNAVVPGSGVVAGIAGGMTTAKITEKTREKVNKSS